MLLKLEQKDLLEKAIKFHNQGKFEKAIKLYSGLLKRNKGNLQLLFQIGTANVQLGNNITGIKYLEKFLDLNPNNSSALINIGNAYKNLRKYNEAIISYNKAIKFDVNSSDSYSNRGIAQLNLNRIDDAILSFDKAIEINPKHFFAYNNKGIAQLNLNRIDDAILSFDKAIEIKQDYIEAYNNRASAYKKINKYDKAISDYEKILSLNPDYEYILGNFLHLKMFLGDWKNYETILKKIEFGVNQGLKVIDPFSYLSLVDNPKHAKLVSEIYVKNTLPDPLDNHSLSPNKNKKPKIAYFSSDFHDHPVMHLMMDVFKNHNKQKFDIFGFSMGPDKKDEWRNKVKNYLYQFFDIQKVSDLDVIDLVKRLKIDIAIDLSGYTGNNTRSIFTNRIAPIQISYLGYPGTSGNKNLDYIISDETIIPKSNFKFFSEKVLYLPNCYQANMRQKEVSEKNYSREEFGLPKHGFVYCCFNNNYKITPNIFNSWVKILKRVKNSVLWILNMNDIAMNNLRNEVIKKDFDPKRIIFAPKMNNKDHLKRITLADLFLDTFPYNAHTTASDSVRMGLPIITITGNSFASRVTTSILKNINMGCLITDRIEDYENLAIELGSNHDKFNKLKIKFKDSVSKSTLFNSLKFTQDLENLFLELI